MTFGRYLAGMVLAAGSLGAVAFGAYALRTRVLPDWSGAPARLAEAVLAVAWVLVVAELLGALGAFDLAPTVLALAVTGVGVGVVMVRGARRVEPPPAAPVGRLGLAVAVLVPALLVGQWGVKTAQSLDLGMTTADSLGYHMPFAARFAQAGEIGHAHYNAPDADQTFFPASSELLHALGIVLFDSDVLSLFLNLGWLGLALLAAWCIGRRFGAAPACLVTVAVVLGSNTLAGGQPGEGKNDIVALALLLAAVALLVNGDGRRWAIGIAGAAAGIALGVKLSAVGPVVGLTAAVVVTARRGSRAAAAAVFVPALAVMGGFWYTRNLFVTGNPLPWEEVDLGPLTLPAIERPFWSVRDQRVIDYATDLDLWRDTFVPGFDRGFGPLWFVVIGLAVAGMVLMLLRGREPLLRALGAVGLVSVAAWAVTPASAGPGGALFVPSLRYLTPALGIGLVLLPLLPELRAASRARWTLLAAGALLLVVQATSDVWTEGHLRLAVAMGAGALVAGAVLASRRLAPRPTAAVLVGILGLAMVLAWPEDREYLRKRYTAIGPPPMRALYSWAADVRDARIAVAGLYWQYPLYGRDLSNHVQYIGRSAPHGDERPVRSCAEWRRELEEGRYRYVVTTPRSFPYTPGREPRERRWTLAGLGGTEILHRGTVSVFRLDGPLRKCREEAT